MRQLKLKRMKEEVIESNPYNEYRDPDMSILDRLIKQTEEFKTQESQFNKKNTDKKKKGKGKKKEKKIKKKKSDNNNLLLDEIDIYGEPTNVVEMKKPDKDTEEFYEYRFGASLILLKDLLKQVNASQSDAQLTLEKFKTSGSRGSLTAIANQYGAINSIHNTKLSVIKEITSVNKNISDLEFKFKDKVAKANAANVSENSELVMDEMFKRLLSSDREAVHYEVEKENDVVFDDFMDSEDNDEFDVMNNAKEIKKKRKNGHSVDDLLRERTRELLDSGDIEFSDNELAFKYENDEVNMVVVVDTENGDYELQALDDDGCVIEDYPLPHPSSIGKLKFDSEKHIAKDRMGNIYPLRYIKR